MAKIAVVDDAAEVLALIGGILRAGGHQVVTYADGVGLEAKLATDRPDLLLLDVVMPERNGFQVLRSLKKAPATRALPVMLVSLKAQAVDVEWGKLQGADDYLTKPFTPEQLLAAVDRLLPRAAP